MTRYLLMIAAALAGVAGPAGAETMTLAQLKRADMVAIQRGYSVAEGACVSEIIKEIEAYGGKAAMRAFKISFEDEPLKITNGKLTHTCDGGVHMWIERGKKLVVQKYDEDGNPTMEEF